MMLSTALGDIIDQTECLIFLNTPESLSINEAKDKKTNSPWIYNELKIASIIRRKYPRKIKNKILLEKSYSEFAEKRKMDLEILYSVDEQLAQMETLNTSKLKNWLELYTEKFNGKVHPLDILYFDSEIAVYCKIKVQTSAKNLYRVLHYFCAKKRLASHPKSLYCFRCRSRNREERKDASNV